MDNWRSRSASDAPTHVSTHLRCARFYYILPLPPSCVEKKPVVIWVPDKRRMGWAASGRNVELFYRQLAALSRKKQQTVLTAPLSPHGPPICDMRLLRRGTWMFEVASLINQPLSTCWQKGALQVAIHTIGSSSLQLNVLISSTD